MSRFLQLHILTTYPPSNLNRDDTGRPKTALVGDAMRLRVSSQSLKRAWRTSEMFQAAMAGHIGVRTKRLGRDVFKSLVNLGVSETNSRDWARSIAGQFGKVKSGTDEDGLDIDQLAHISPEEQAAVDALVSATAEQNTAPSDGQLALLRRPASAVDIAMFGRMLADSPAFNVEAAVQVAHAITVHKAAVEDDYFSAVDDLNAGLEDKGAGHIGERGYGAGLFYLYLCIDRELLEENLGGDATLAARALEALMNAVTRVSPTGMQNSFASRAYAGFILAESGDQQPRSLVQAFLKPIRPSNEFSMFDEAVKAIKKRRENFDKVYGPCADSTYEINVETGEGTLSELAAFARS